MHPYRLVLTAFAISVLLLPASAGAAPRVTTVSVSLPVLQVTAAAGVDNDLSVVPLREGYTVLESGGPLAAGGGCTEVGPGEVACQTAGISRAEVELGDGDADFANRANLTAYVRGGDGNDTLEDASPKSPSPRSQFLDGNDGKDVLRGGPANDTLDGGPGPDVLTGGDGRDTADYSDRAAKISVEIDGLAGDGEFLEGDNVGVDVEDVRAGAGNDVLKGSAAGNGLSGGSGEDTVEGLAGDDTLAGGRHDDLLEGGPDNDTFVARQLTAGDGDDDLNGGTGFDEADYNRLAPVFVDLDGLANDGGASESDNVRLDVERVEGGKGDDVLTGSALGSDTLDGWGGDDELRGLGGDDVLIGGPHNDLLDAIDAIPGNDSLDGSNGTDQCDSDAGDAETGCEL